MTLEIDTEDAVLWETFLAVGERRRYQPQSALFLEGDPPGTVFAVIDGEVRITGSGDGGEVILSTCGPGHLLGEVSAIDGLPRSASALAVTEVEVVALAAGRFNQLLEEQPQLALRVMRLLANRLRHSTDDRVRHGVGDAMTQVARQLVHLADDRGQTVGTLIRVPATRAEVADGVGGDHEAASQALAGLAGEGWLELSDGAFDILNLPALRRLAADAHRPAL